MEVVEEGRFREVPPVGVIVRDILSRPRVISDGCRHTVHPEGEFIGPEEGACNFVEQGREPVGPPLSGGVVATVPCVGYSGHAGIHYGDLCDHCCNL